MKWRIVGNDPVAVSASLGLFRFAPEAFNERSGDAVFTVVPFDLAASWRIDDQWTLSPGLVYTVVTLKGSYDPAELQGVAAISNLQLLSTLEYRLTKRTAFVLHGRYTVFQNASGRVSSTLHPDPFTAVDLQAVASADALDFPNAFSVVPSVVLSWGCSTCGLASVTATTAFQASTWSCRRRPSSPTLIFTSDSRGARHAFRGHGTSSAMLRRMTILSAAATLVLVSCGGPPESTTPREIAPTVPAAPSASASPVVDAGAAESTSSAKPVAADETGSAKERLMRSHFKETAVIRTAVINGVLRDAAAPADALGKMDGLGTVQKNWQPAIEALQSASKRIVSSPDIPGAAAATADIGVACGSCHRVAGGPKVKLEAPPAVDSSLASRMRRHVWATERLWEALYAPSDGSWKAGVDALGADPFPKELLDQGGVHARSAAARFKSIVFNAGTKQKTEDRAKVYASLLETCSACHMATRGTK